MRAIIPVAGLGTRLKPHTHSVPKVLLNVGGKPMLAHIIDKLVEAGVGKATFIIGHLGIKIESFVKTTYPQLQCDFIVQHEMLGLGHAIHLAVPTFDDEELFIILGDTIFDVNLINVFKSKYSSLGVKEVDDARRFGVAIIENGFITQLVEKPQIPVSKLALVGLYYIKNSGLLEECLNEIINKDIRTRGEFQLTDALQLMLDKDEKITTFNVDGWYDCGKPETLLATNEFLLFKNGTNRRIEGVVINDPVFISDNAIIENSVIGPYTTIAEGCVIKNSIIRNSIISSDSSVEKSMLENSIIGSNAIIKGSFQKLNAGDSSEIEFY
jgi:glucose-1-phosphate thymidylyltransferase